MAETRAPAAGREGEAQRKRLVLIDGHSLFFRAFFALPPLTTAEGQPTNAVYGFALMLSRLLADERPEYAAVAFDRGAPAFRIAAFAGYKAHRPETPDELASQLPLVKELLSGYGLPIVEKEGYEADDLIGTLARRAAAERFAVLIVTGDRDMLQLVSHAINALITRKGITEMDRFDPDRVRGELGISPDQVIDWKALVGDKSDNIPGVAGIGPKTAQKLLSEYGDVEGVLAHAGEIGGKVGRTLAEQAETARLSKRLATIDCEAPIELDWEACRLGPPHAPRLYDLFSRLEFRNLLRDLVERFPDLDRPASVAPVNGGPAMDGAGEAGGKGVASPSGPDLELTIARTPQELTEWAAARAAGAPMAVLVLADGDEAMRAPLCGVGLACGDRAVYAPLNEDAAPWTRALASVLAEGAPPLVAHDAKRQAVLLGRAGVALPAVQRDVMLASYVLGAGQGRHTLAEVAMRHLKRRLPAPGEAGLGGSGEERGRAARRKPALVELDCEAQAEWARSALAVILQAAPRLEAQLAEDELEELYRRIEMPLIPVLVEMERTGVALDIEKLQAMSGVMDEEIAALTERIYELAGEPFNINSPRQLGHVLFEKLGLPVLQKTKTGPSTSADVLEELADQHAIAAALLDYRQLVKLKSTYVDVLPGLVNPRTGRVHTTYNQVIAATGRLSSVNPNLQNIPIRTEAGRKIRAAFIPGEPGWRIVAADYSQIELRVLAHISEDENLLTAFRDGIDIHTKTASEIFDVALARVTPAMRTAAKAVNFGIVYGISSFGLARGTGLSRAEAQAYIDAYFERYPGVKRYMENIVAEARQTGFVRTLFKRRRHLPDLTSRKFMVRSFAERTAINTPIQGTAADIIKAAMVDVHRSLREHRLSTRMLLQVHDELVFEAPAEAVPATARLVKEAMEQVVDLRLPLVAAVEAGPNWLETEPVP